MKKIIVPTDFSKLSGYALDFAVKLANPLDAEIVVLHLEEVPLGDLSLNLSGEAGGSQISTDSLYIAQLFRANKQKLEALRVEYSNENVSVHQAGGGFLKGIEHYVENHGADLVVIGTTGQESIHEFFSGNHTEQLIEHLSVPVISLQDKQFHKIEDIVLGLDIEDEVYTKKIFEHVKMITEALDARLHIVDITKSSKDEELLSRLNKIAKIAGLSNYMVDVIEDKHASAALLNYAQGADASLIITLSEARSGFQRFLQHSFSTRLTKKSSIPVMTINKGHFF
ncbi:universal stress protein [Ekhidna sp.]|uniref:universal stress protein n=1 Tax=Ekhidna sp. TaxID=2608089 RepID=UPI003B5B0CD4